MTTIVYDRASKTIAADTQNTDSANARWRVKKIEVLDDGRVFLGSGHSFTINQVKEWAKANWSPEATPDWEYFNADPEDRGFQCLLIEADGERVWMVDEELTPMLVDGPHLAVGSGAAYALGALYGGADVVAAIEAAAKYDTSTSAPIDTYTFQG